MSPTHPRLALVLRWLAFLAGAGALVFLAASTYVERRYAGRIHTLAQVPAAPVALVFGAGLSRNREPSRVLAERLDTALSLLAAGKVQRLLLSGDNLDPYHDEPLAMRRYVLSRGAPEAAVLVDDHGLSTYDSCQRAKLVFGVDRAVLVTQDFHLPRALFLANSLGIDAHGVEAGPPREGWTALHFRELVSRAWAVALVLTRPASLAQR